VLPIAANWLRLERPDGSFWTLAAVVALAFLPALAGRWWLRGAVAAGALALASGLAFRVRLDRHFGAHLASRFGHGMHDFYTYMLPVDPHRLTAMHGVILLAIFGFCAGLAVLIRTRRATAASLVVCAGAGWPATLLAGGHELWRGLGILLAALLVLAGVGGSGRLGRAVAPALGIALAALAVSASPAGAKHPVLDWQHWRLFGAAPGRVSVRFIWNAGYSGVSFPARKTAVLEIQAPRRSLYWRATTLDTFRHGRWIETLTPLATQPVEDPLEPEQASRRSGWVRQRVTVRALRDVHLVGASVPQAYDAGKRFLLYERGGVALQPQGLARGQTYLAWSWAPDLDPEQLARSRPFRSRRLRPFLQIAHARAYRPLYRTARRLVGTRAAPYAAAVTLETWFRRTGGFRYDEQPPHARGPALVDFVERTRRGYCQHFAGAMALMLRSLGIPARVAAGFTSGRYDAKGQRWIVTDHDAHTWVEVWFRGYGWLPFDPTPGRGRLGSSYSASSRGFDVRSVLGLLGSLARSRVAPLSGPSRRPDPFQGPRSLATGSGRGSELPPTPLLVLLALGLAAGAVPALKAVRRRSGLRSADPRAVARACRRELAGILVDQRLDVPPAATLAELGVAAREELGVETNALVAAASAARYAAPDEARGAARRVGSELRELRRGLRVGLSRTARLRGALSVRSLRAA
jgi:hypothetical protein